MANEKWRFSGQTGAFDTIYLEHHAQIIFNNKPLTSFSFKLSIPLLWSLFIQAKLRSQT